MSYERESCAVDYPILEQRRAFTLIELLVVIAIIALLMAILVPTLQQVRRQARAVVCQSNLRQWGSVFAIYAEENNGHLPSRFDFNYNVWNLLGSVASTKDPNIPESLRQIDTKRIAICPMTKKPVTNDWSWTENGVLKHTIRWGSTFHAWELMYPIQFRASFGLNDWLFNRRYDRSIPMYLRSRLDYIEISSLKGRSKIPVLLDCTRPEGPGGTPDTIFEPPRREPPRGPSIFGTGRFCINRHNEYINGLFLDWSVRKVGLKELWTLKWHREFNTANEWTLAGGVKPEDWPKWMRKFKDY
jgi:prepilin-type N-terminal cleavage/methylation domain-containing protein/prepilin-type processing-associated H-X9-DG protein